MDEFHRIYEWFGVKFDHFFYESEVSEESQKSLMSLLPKDSLRNLKVLLESIWKMLN